ncbi:UNVERIFIED_CONTAM: hypothetical protein FKN15_054492 [Acipenser sinensis]
MSQVLKVVEPMEVSNTNILALHIERVTSRLQQTAHLLRSASDHKLQNNFNYARYVGFFSVCKLTFCNIRGVAKSQQRTI